MDKLHIGFSLDKVFSDIGDLNDSFAFGSMKVAYAGVNVNHTSISKEAFEASVSSMYNCPIVANYDVESNEIGGHDEAVVEIGDESRYVNITYPVGVVPESATYHWEQIEDNGVMHEYFCIDGVILWKRQPCFSKLISNGITSQSFEIRVKKGNLNDGLLEIDQFQYEAFCLLERDAPCFEQASLQVFSNQFKQQWSQMMEEYSSSGVPDKLQIKTGGARMEETNPTNAICSIEEAEMHEPILASSVADGVLHEEFSLLASQVREALKLALKEIQDKGEDDLYLQDWDDAEIYIYDYADGLIYGYTYTMSGTSAVIDKDSKKQKIMTYVDATPEITSNSILSEVIDAIAKTSATAISAEYDTQIQTLNTQIADLNQQTSELLEFKQQRLAADRSADEAKLFARFEPMLKNSGEFKALEENSSQYTIQELETQCYALVGKQTYAVSDRKNNMSAACHVPIDFSRDVEQEDPYGGLLKGKKKIYGGNE